MGMFSQIAVAVERDLVWRGVVARGSSCPGVLCGGLHLDGGDGSVFHLQPLAIASERDGTPVLRVLLATWVPVGGRASQPDIWLESYNGVTCDFDGQERHVSPVATEHAPVLADLVRIHGGEDGAELADALWTATLMAGSSSPVLEVAR